MKFSKRKLLFGIGSGAVGTISLPGVGSAFAAEEVPDILVEKATNTNQDILAYTTLDKATRVLYIATGTTSQDDTPADIIRVAGKDDGSVRNIRWKSPTELRFWQNSEVRKVSVMSGSVGKPTTVKEKEPMPGIEEVQSTPSFDPDQIIKPPGGSAPDWVDDPSYTHSGGKECISVGPEWFEYSTWCAEVGEVSPKVFATCNGENKTLAGAEIEGVTISAAGTSYTISIDLWMGYQPVEECSYIGSDSLDFCHRWCGIGPTATMAEWEEQLEAYIYSSLEELDEFFPDIPNLNYDLNRSEVAVLIIAVLAALAKLLFSPLDPTLS
ncbi:hypothetical protein [Halobacterium rubrum]|uniref:hypothetical protein n=1 Tax=Halobacterium TaxID=2239 RepID=UPI001F4746BC|nr:MULTISPECIES: hypothetical protein [Halobacterium]MDH5020885.1 hypothetical protein [Halobacterium rubrum]